MSQYEKTSPPNVIIILSDDQGYGDFSCHGNPEVKTPNFDRLHDESVRFTDFHVAPMCTPTRGQIVTGQDALRNGASSVFCGRTFLRRGIPTMADIFAANGYRTGLFGKWHLGDNYPFRPEDRGFQETVYFPSATITIAPDYWNNDYFDDHYRHNGKVQQYQGYCTDVFFEETMRWMRRCHEDGKPFFAYLATGADHMPYFVPDHYRDPYRHLNIYLASFYAMVANYDENMGKLEAFLARTGLRDDALLIFMTDNGAVVSVDHFNAGMREGKGSLYDGGHRVPCFVRWPNGGLRQPGPVDQPAQCQDILPTLIDLCALTTEIPAACNGTSLAEVLRDERAALPERMMVVQYGEPEFGTATVMWGKWRLVAGRELYDLANDPGQQSDMAAVHPDVMERMRTHYDLWWAGLGEAVSELERIGVGSARENPLCLSHTDWRGPILSYQSQVRSLFDFSMSLDFDGSHTLSDFNGVWHLRVERAGDYEISLCRWPREAETPISAALPESIPTDRTFYHLPQPGMEAEGQVRWAWLGASSQPGKALPIAAARCRIADFDQTISVAPEDTAASFRMTLLEGPTTMQTWFYDRDAHELCGAFYVYVKWLGQGK